MLTCDFNLCIYQKGGMCVLESVDINEYGMCDCAILIEIGEDMLAALKEKRLATIKGR